MEQVSYAYVKSSQTPSIEAGDRKEQKKHVAGNLTHGSRSAVSAGTDK